MQQDGRMGCVIKLFPLIFMFRSNVSSLLCLCGMSLKKWKFRHYRLQKKICIKSLCLCMHPVYASTCLKFCCLFFTCLRLKAKVKACVLEMLCMAVVKFFSFFGWFKENLRMKCKLLAVEPLTKTGSLLLI